VNRAGPRPDLGAAGSPTALGDPDGEHWGMRISGLIDTSGIANCGTGTDVGTYIWGGTAPIQIEYADLTGVAQLTVKWDQGTGDWQTIPSWLLAPDLGIVTSKITERLQSGGGTPDLLEESWTYPTDDDKARRLQASHVVEDLTTGATRETDYTYNTYGQVKTETANAPRRRATMC
jgi:hypothetical protein